MKMSKNKFEIDMINGSLMPKLISFFVPLMFSTVLQLLFNAVDLIVVGRFAGDTYLAAVGATTSLINLFTNVFIGISLGTNVCVARSYAEGNQKRTSAVVHTSMLFALIIGVIMLFAGRFFTRPALELMDTPENVIDYAVEYMEIYFLGAPLFMLYNFGAAILRAVGDTKRPMIFLVIAGITNACLNLIFVISFKMDVDGVAIATVISQAISCILIIIVLLRSPEEYRLHISKLKINFFELKKIVSIGLPAGIQSAVINFSNVLLQSSVNSFGQDAMAGYTAANNVFGFLYAGANAITQACMSFTSQNMGAGKYNRMKKVLVDCLILETVLILAMGCCAYFFGPQILGIYSKSDVVKEYGMQVLALTTTTYFICGYMDCIPGALRGMGHSSVPMILSIIGTVGIRIFWIYVVFPHDRNLRFLFMSYPVSWIATCIMQVICYLVVLKAEKKKMVGFTQTEGSY
jgi:putative MATE family efflux protein